MRCIKRRADGSGEQPRRRSGKSWMFRRTLPQTEQSGGKRRQPEERNAFQADQRIGSDQFLAPKGGRDAEEFQQTGRRQESRNDREHQSGTMRFSARLRNAHDQFSGKHDEQKSKANLEQESRFGEQRETMRPRAKDHEKQA